MRKRYFFFGSFLLTSSLCSGQLISNLPIHIGEDALVSVHMPVINESTFENRGEVHLYQGLTNLGTWKEQGLIRFQGSQRQSVKGTLAAHVLEIAGDVQVQSPIRVEKSIVFLTGILEGDVTFGASARTENASDRSHIVGKVKKEGLVDFTFPIGNGHQVQEVRFSQGNQENISLTYIPQSPLHLSPQIHSDLSELTSNDYWVAQSDSPSAQASIEWVHQASDVAVLQKGTWKASPGKKVQGSQGLANGIPFTLGQIKAIDRQIGIWPNPTQGEFQLHLRDFPENAKLHVEVVTVDGRKVVDSQGTTQSLRSTYRLPDGLVTSQLTVRVLHDGTWWTEKLVYQP